MGAAVTIVRKEGIRKPVIVVSKKVAQKSSDRNLLKRRIRAVVRPFERKGSYFFVVAKPGVSDLSFKELQEEMRSQLNANKD